MPPKRRYPNYTQLRRSARHLHYPSRPANPSSGPSSTPRMKLQTKPHTSYPPSNTDPLSNTDLIPVSPPPSLTEASLSAENMAQEIGQQTSKLSTDTKTALLEMLKSQNEKQNCELRHFIAQSLKESSNKLRSELKSDLSEIVEQQRKDWVSFKHDIDVKFRKSRKKSVLPRLRTKKGLRHSTRLSRK